MPLLLYCFNIFYCPSYSLEKQTRCLNENYFNESSRAMNYSGMKCMVEYSACSLITSVFFMSVVGPPSIIIFELSLMAFGFYICGIHF